MGNSHKGKVTGNTGYADLWGNRIDRLIQNGQEKQTKGIPIGPDTSLIAAEFVLTAIDMLLAKSYSKSKYGYFRYLDDYEISVDSYDQAENSLSTLQEALSDFELSLNESKTSIIELPISLEQPWIGALRNFDISPSYTPSRQETNLIDFFDLSISNWRSNPADAVVRYAVIKSAASYIAIQNWQLYQHQLMMWATTEPEVLPVVLDILHIYKGFGYPIDLDLLQDTLNTTILVHSKRGHTSEVAWALWGHLLFGTHLNTQSTKTVCAIDNAVIALLALDANGRSLLTTHKDFSKWARHMTSTELQGEHWLLAYEARIKKWLPPVSSKEYVKTTHGFSQLGTSNVSFYDKVDPGAHTPSGKRFDRLRRIAAAQSPSTGYLTFP
jgi:hypothetical protein